MEHKRLTLFAGHYGSGKTNIAVNYAIMLSKEGKKVCIGDLDIVNPYFRTADSKKQLQDAGVELISLPFASRRRPTGWWRTKASTALWISAVTTGGHTPWDGISPQSSRRVTTVWYLLPTATGR